MISADALIAILLYLEHGQRERRLNAIGYAHTDAAFNAAWLRWYFDDGGAA